MKILLIHNRYQHRGGEDVTFETERDLLAAQGNEVRTVVFDNKDIRGVTGSINAAMGMIYNREARKRVVAAIDEFQPDVIHVHNFFYVASPSVLYAAHSRNVPVVVTIHNYRLICSGSLLMRDGVPCEVCTQSVFPLAGVRYKCHRESAVQTAHLTLVTGVHKLMNTWKTKVDRFVAITEFARLKLVNSSLKLDPKKVVVKWHSAPDPGVSGPERGSSFLFVGRLSPEKGIALLLEAFRDQPHQLEILGDGPLKHLVEDAARGSGNIRYLGFAEKPVILEKMKRSKALIFPSTWYEGLPFTLIEAMSTGTPVIISNLGNLTEIITDGYNGLHFKAGDAADLRKTVAQFAAGSYDILYQNARTTYQERYTPERNYENLINLYNEVIAGRKSRDQNPGT